MSLSIRLLAILVAASALALPTLAQEKSVNPGINDSFLDPDVNDFTNRFEVESREIFARRREIVAACRIQPGETVADIGAGTGLFTRLFADAVGKQGRVIAVDISQKFLDHIASASREEGRRNIDTLLATAASTELAPASIDVAFICDTYHHFEFPQKTMASLFQALKPGGRVILVDFRRIPGTSSDWVLNHVRAGQDVFEAEIIDAGFEKASEEPELLQENYFVVYKKGSADEQAPAVGRSRRMRPGRGVGRGRGPDAAMRADQEVFHYLLDHHAEIHRTVTRTDNGVQTLTESDRPEVAKKIQEHVASMHKRVEEGRGLRYWDDLFAALFERHASIQMSVENTEKGVLVKESSDNPIVVALVQAHAEVVSKFVAKGFEEARRNHPAPTASKGTDLRPEE